MSTSTSSVNLSTIECHVGRRVRAARSMMGVSQKRMGEMLGISARQQHLYETAQSRITAGRLDQMARLLHVDITYFFEGLNGEPNQVAVASNHLLFDLTRNFLNIRSHHHRIILCNAAEAFALSDREQPVPPKREATLKQGEDIHNNLAEIHRK